MVNELINVVITECIELLWSPYGIGQTIVPYFHPVVSSFFLSSFIFLA